MNVEKDQDRTEEWNYEPARDLGLASTDRFRSVDREPGLISYLARKLCWAIVHLWLRIRQRLRIIGQENVPKELPFVLVANHTSHLDALVLSAAAPRCVRPSVFPVAAGDHFFETKATALLSSLTLNALPLWRNRCGKASLEALRARLQDQSCACILFPEGTRSRDGNLRDFKAGLGLLIAGTTVPVVPCFIEGAYEAWPPDAKKPRPGRVTVHVGAPRTYSDLPNDRRGWETLAADLHSSVTQLDPRYRATDS